jgi:hypothetical protein
MQSIYQQKNISLNVGWPDVFQIKRKTVCFEYFKTVQLLNLILIKNISDKIFSMVTLTLIHLIQGIANYNV